MGENTLGVVDKLLYGKLRENWFTRQGCIMKQKFNTLDEMTPLGKTSRGDLPPDAILTRRDHSIAATPKPEAIRSGSGGDSK